MFDDKIQNLNTALRILKNKSSFSNVQEVINNVISILNIDIENKDWKLFTDSNGKIASNAGWFNTADGYEDRRATYSIDVDKTKNLDLKVFWLKDVTKPKISWCVALTPNFEDYDGMDLGDNVGIDFIISDDLSKITIILSNNYVLRVLELQDSLSNTQKEIFEKWYQDFDFQNKKLFHDILWQSFDFEPVNKKFFKGISSFFIESVQYLYKQKNILGKEESAFFTNRLIGRLIFIWFLEKKGIISPKPDYFNTEGLDADKYYKNKLSKLFFGVLNTEIKDRDVNDKKTPYLNGGLFEEKEDDTKILSSSDAFVKDYFDRFFEFLNHYNFTTDESSSDYQQTAIDPEMLGRIFENLLAEQNVETGESARKAKGSFYTPREIVDYMSKESLLQYLKTKVTVQDDHKEYLERIVTEELHLWRDQQRNYRRDIKPYKDEIIKALDSFKVLDPACGSGAYPMGMMQLLVRTYERIEARFDPMVVKKQIIKNNIFGVDIDPMAIEISRLRAWLSIIVDEDDDSKKIKPLPNLDFKFITANTLLKLEKDEGLFDNEDLKEQIQEIREEYFSTGEKRKKKSLQKMFYKLTNNGTAKLGMSKREEQLLTYDPFNPTKVSEFFDPEFMFSIDKFDLVIGNPPYIQLQDKKKISAEMQKKYENQKYKTFKKTGDIYALFYERGLDIVKENTGLLCYITSNKWMRAKYGESLRKYFSEKNPLQLMDFGGFSVFESATVDTNILLIENSKNKNSTLAVHFKKDYKKGDNLKKYIDKNKSELKNLTSNTWSILLPIEQSIKDQIEKIGTPLKDWDIKINRGVLTGFNEAFIIDGKKKDELIAKDPKSAEIIKPILRGKDIKKYYADFADKWLIATLPAMKLNIDDYSAIKEYLESFGQKLEQTGEKHIDKNGKEQKSRKKTGNKWFETQDQINYYKEFEKEKIVWGNIAYEASFTFDEGSFINAPANLLTSKSVNVKYLVSIMNSKIFSWEFENLGIPLGRAFEWKKQYVEQIHIPQISPEAQKPFIDLVDKILKITSAENYDPKKPPVEQKELEKQIDKMVYELYGLTEEEIKIIKNLSKR